MFVLLFILGLLPFAAGYGMTFVPLLYEGYMAYVTAGVFIILWYMITALGKKLCRKIFKTAGNINVPGLIVLVLILIQILFTKGLWPNEVGRWSGFFFSPVVPFGQLIAEYLPRDYFQIWTYICSFGIMLLTSFISALFTKAKKVVKTESGNGSGLEELARQAEQSQAELQERQE